MKRLVARLSPWWTRAFVASVVLFTLFVDARWWISLGIPVALLLLALVRAPWDRARAPVTVEAPVRGRWVATNSPGTKVPSHGVRAYAQTYAVDVLHPKPSSASPRVGWGLGVRRPSSFPTFGDTVRAVAGGEVVAVARRQRDHRSRTTWPSLAYMLVVEGFVREVGGPRFVLGNHVVVDHGDGTWSAYAHLRRDSVQVAVGDRVEAGRPLAEVGNSGSSSEPHLHVQLMDRPVTTEAAGVPFRWRDVTVTGEVDPSRASKAVSTEAEPGLPRDGQVFVAG